MAQSLDGRVIVSAQLDGAFLLRADHPEQPLQLRPHGDVRYVAVSPDGKWAATGSHGPSLVVKIWEVDTGKLVKTLRTGGGSRVAFSPDGQWLATGTAAEYCIWEVGSWQKKHGLRRENAGSSMGWIVFSPDGKIVALLHSTSAVRLVDPATGREIATLPTAGEPYCFSPDGSQLVTYAGRDGAFQIWDLRLIRRQLRELGLDWDPPPSPLAPEGEGQGVRGPLPIKVLTAEHPLPSKELDADAYFERGLLHVQLRLHARATSDINRARALNPNLSRWDELVDAYSELIGRYAQDAEAYHQRANAHKRLGQWEKAIDDHSQAIKLAPQRLDLLYYRGQAFLHIGQMNRAAEDLRKAKLNPDQANSLAWKLATSPNLLHREPSLAVELAKRAVRQAPGEAMYWNTLGVAHYRAREWEAAIKALEEAEKLRPGKTFGYNAFFLAMCHHQLGDPVKAKDSYDRAVRWYEENQSKLATGARVELKTFRAEAEALLKATPPGP